MSRLNPVRDSNVWGVVSKVIRDLGSEPAARTLRHYVAVRKLAESGHLISEARLDRPESAPWILTTCQSGSTEIAAAGLSRNVERFQSWFADRIIPVADTRWSEDGVTLLHGPGNVVDALTFGHDAELHAFTRFPLIGKSCGDGFSLAAKQLESRVVASALVCHRWHQELGLSGTLYIDVSLVAVQGVGLQSTPRAVRRLGRFKSNYLHLTHEWVCDQDRGKLGLDGLCDRLWQAGGWSQSQFDTIDDLEG